MAKHTYDPAEIEPKWQEFWETREVFRTPNPGDPGFDPSKPKYYVLDMFPYPSGAGLHVGHPAGYTATDIIARYKRMKGFNVLHPMGWDAFGLPAEQHAVQTGTHPRITTEQNINVFRGQLKRLGFWYDWGREVSTTDPAYFRWTQWIFSRLYEKGLAYVEAAPVWWCEALGTVLANEEVINGRSERGDHPCERRPLEQWKLRITAYAERLLADLDDVDWPESVVKMQRDWIGRSEGAEIDFELDGHSAEKIRVFTTRPDTLFGASFMVLAPEHPLVEKITTEAQRGAVNDYVASAATKTELERTDLATEKTGVWTGAHALNPLLPADDPGAKLPVWIADYVILTYGTGAIMAVPAGDERDFEFAQTFGLAVPPIFAPETGDAEQDAAVRAGEACCAVEAAYLNSRNDEGLDLTGLSKADGIRAATEWLAARGRGEAKVNYKLRDWLFSRQRYWGEPFPILHREDGTTELVPDEQLPLELPEIEDFKPSGSPDGLLVKAEDWMRATDSAGKPARRETNTMPQWAGSCWYYLRFLDPHNSGAMVDPEVERYWMPVDLYVGGTEHAVLHLLYARFWHKVLFDLGLVSTAEPFRKLFNQGMIQSWAYKDRRGGIVPADRAEAVDDGYRDVETGEALTQVVAKMSKSLRNVVNPDTVIDELGTDTLRLYEMYMGPLADPKPWNPKDVPGVHRFLHRVWRLVVPAEEGGEEVHPYLREDRQPQPELERALHKTIDKVGADIEKMAFNTALAAMMSFVNEATKQRDALTRGQALRFVQILTPFAPHLGEELWSRLGGVEILAYAAWPAVDPSMLEESRIEMPVQVNGKLRERIQVAADASQDDVLAIARDAVASHLDGKNVVKEIVVKGRLVNFVAK